MRKSNLSDVVDPASSDKRMLAVKKNQAGPGFEMASDAPVPRLGPRDVMIAVTLAGVCGTDRHIYEWDAWSASRVALGVTVGHEFVGKIVRVGDAVEQFAPGQRVSAEGHIGCGQCEPCRTGRPHICERVDILGIDRDGCFAEYVVVPETNVWPVHPQITDATAAVFDPLGNAMHTVMAAGVSGRTVLITGVGIIGLMAVSIARAAGAGTILVTDVNEHRLELAKALGADVVLNAADDAWPREARAQTRNQGPQVLLEMSGHAGAIRGGFTALQNGGTAALLGLPAEPVSLHLPDDIIFKGATVLGINGRRIFETWYQVENFVLAGNVNLDPIITHTLALGEYGRAIELMQSGEAIKVLLAVSQDA